MSPVNRPKCGLVIHIIDKFNTKLFSVKPIVSSPKYNFHKTTQIKNGQVAKNCRIQSPCFHALPLVAVIVSQTPFSSFADEI
jgi:hypothetical protein